MRNGPQAHPAPLPRRRGGSPATNILPAPQVRLTACFPPPPRLKCARGILSWAPLRASPLAPPPPPKPPPPVDARPLCRREITRSWVPWARRSVSNATATLNGGAGVWEHPATLRYARHDPDRVPDLLDDFFDWPYCAVPIPPVALHQVPPSRPPPLRLISANKTPPYSPSTTGRATGGGRRPSPQQRPC